MLTQHTVRGPASRGQTLWVMLPAAYTHYADFHAAGFFGTLHAAQAHADACVAEAHVGLISQGHATALLHDTVIVPARAQGYREIFLLGISIGGLLVLDYLGHCRTLGLPPPQGLCVLAPYLGARPLTQAVHAAGGVTAWHQTTPPSPQDDAETRAWHTLATRQHPPFWLGYGAQDRFAPAHHTLASHLAAHEKYVQAGGHDWSTWSSLWHHFWLQKPFESPA